MAAPPDPAWFIGLVGFSYPEWENTFYRGVRKSVHRLAHYATLFNTVEINTTFYGVPTAKTARAWRDMTPDGFRFCVKMPRDVTHGPTPPGALASNEPPIGHLLRDETLGAARRLVEAIEPIRAKLGAVLMQFPRRFSADRRGELAGFLERFGGVAPLAVELRHDSWRTPETSALLSEHGACWVAADESPRRDVEANEASATDGALGPTAGFLYVRWLGRHGQFPDRSHEHFDPTARLLRWAERLRAAVREHPGLGAVYGFFDNDFAGHAPATAQRFAAIVGGTAPVGGSRPPKQRSLFD